MFRTTVIGGVLFLLPLAVVLAVLGKALQMSLMVAEPVAAALHLEGNMALLLAGVASALALLVLCYLAGLLAARAAVRRRFMALEGRLMDMLPPYAMAKAMVGAMARAEGEAALLRPVLVRFDDHEQMAFEVERSGERVALFLPGAPNPWSGTTVIVESARVRPLDAPSHEMVRLLGQLGRGSLAATGR
jgi:uncharacterized membrane protein